MARESSRTGQPSTLEYTETDLRQAGSSVQRALVLREELAALKAREQRDRKAELVVLQQLLGQVDLGRRFLEEVIDRHEKEAKL